MVVETSPGDSRQSEHGFSATQPNSQTVADQDVEQYGVWVKAGPVDLADDEEQEEHFKMEDLEPESEDSSLTQEEEELLGSLEDEESALPETEIEELEFEELPELDDSALEHDSLDNPEMSPEAQDSFEEETHNLDQEGIESLEDMGDLGLDLADSNEEEDSMETRDGSAAILQKIEQDLLSIKEELTALKNEISSLRGDGKQPATDEEREETESGFFEEDEDETIALTGDELDNILNTADITEQTGQSTASPEENDLVLEEEPDTTESIIDRDDVLFDEEATETPEDVPAAESEDDLLADESFADVAALTEESTDDLTIGNEQAPIDEEEVLDLPEEEEITLDEITTEESGTTTDDLDLEQFSQEGATEEIELEDISSDELTIEDLSPETEEVTIEEPSPAEEEINLEDLGPAEEEINLEDISPVEEEINLDDLTPSETEVSLEEPASPEEESGTFELDEELQLSPSEQEDLEASQDLLAAEELSNLGDDLEIDENELAEMEAESAESDVADAETTDIGSIDLTEESLQPPEEITLETEAPDLEQEGQLPDDLKSEIRAILKYMDQLLESLPEEKIEEFANSEYFDVYKRLFEELGLST